MPARAPTTATAPAARRSIGLRRSGHTEIITLLLAAKATVDAQNKQGITPLMMAAANGKVEAIRALLAAGADPKKQDFTGRDALGWAAGKPAALRALQAAHSG